MPFIKEERRQGLLDKTIEPEGYGDLCFIVYHEMVAQWKTNPRWATAHQIKKQHIVNYEPNFGWFKGENMGFNYADYRTATSLAWDVFFQLHVMPYEIKKREENGDIL